MKKQKNTLGVKKLLDLSLFFWSFSVSKGVWDAYAALTVTAFWTVLGSRTTVYALCTFVVDKSLLRWSYS